MTLPDKPWMKVSVAADKLKASTRTVERYCEDGTLDCERLPKGHWRVLRESVEKILRQMRQTRQQ